MTIAEILEDVDRLKPNAYDDLQKIKWLSVIDGQIYNEIFRARAGLIPDFHGYDAATDPGTELLVGETYGRDLYMFYLYSCIDREDHEDTGFNQNITLFNAAYQNFANAYNRTHGPLQCARWGI